MGTSIQFNSMGSTMMACQPELMSQEQNFLQTLAAVNTLTYKKRELVLEDSNDGRRLVFGSESARLGGELIFQGELPANSEVTVRLEDSSLQDTAAITIAEKIFKTEKTTTHPLIFSLNYAPHLIQPGHSYTLRSQIISEGRLIYATSQRIQAQFSGGPMVIPLDMLP